MVVDQLHRTAAVTYRSPASCKWNRISIDELAQLMAKPATAPERPTTRVASRRYPDVVEPLAFPASRLELVECSAPHPVRGPALGPSLQSDRAQALGRAVLLLVSVLVGHP